MNNANKNIYSFSDKAYLDKRAAEKWLH